MFGFAKNLLGAVGRVLGGGKGGPLAVGVVDQIGKTGEVGILIAGVALLVLASGVGYFIVMFANWLFT